LTPFFTTREEIMDTRDKSRAIFNTWAGGIALVLSIFALAGVIGLFYFTGTLADMQAEWNIEPMQRDIEQLQETVKQQQGELKELREMVEMKR